MAICEDGDWIFRADTNEIKGVCLNNRMQLWNGMQIEENIHNWVTMMLASTCTFYFDSSVNQIKDVQLFTYWYWDVFLTQPRRQVEIMTYFLPPYLLVDQNIGILADRLYGLVAAPPARRRRRTTEEDILSYNRTFQFTTADDKSLIFLRTSNRAKRNTKNNDENCIAKDDLIPYIYKTCFRKERCIVRGPRLTDTLKIWKPKNKISKSWNLMVKSILSTLCPMASTVLVHLYM